MGSDSISQGVLVCELPLDSFFCSFLVFNKRNQRGINGELDEVKFNGPFKGGSVDTVVEGEQTLTIDDDSVELGPG